MTVKKIPLSKLALFLNGYAFKSSKYVNNGIRVIRIANVQDGYISDEAPCFYGLEFLNELERYLLYENDFLISLTGNVGRVALLKKELLPAALNQRVCCIRLKSKSLLIKYLFYYLRRKQFQIDCINASKGVAQLNLSPKWLESYLIPVPPLAEQERIVTRIEELFSQLDAGIETLKTIQTQLTLYRQAVLKDVFSHYKDNCQCVEIKDVCQEIKVGIVIKPAQYYTNSDEGIKAFRSANVREFYVNNNDWKYITKEGHKDNQRSEIHTGDVLIVRSGYPGTSCVVPEKFNGCNAIDILIAVPDHRKILPEYLCAYTNSPYGKKLVTEKKRGVAQAHLNVSGYSKLEIILPTLKQQKEIVSVINKSLSVCDSIEQTIETSLQQAESLRQSILKQAFEGRL